MTPMLFAHQGGWDEILFAISPLVVVGALLWLANQRAKKIQQAAAAADPVDGAPAPGTERELEG